MASTRTEFRLIEGSIRWEIEVHRSFPTDNTRTRVVGLYEGECDDNQIWFTNMEANTHLAGERIPADDEASATLVAAMRHWVKPSAVEPR